MDVDDKSVDASEAVRTARTELAAVILSLTEVLGAVSASKAEASNDKAANGKEAEAQKKEKEAEEKKTSLNPVLARLNSLRKAVEVAVAGHDKVVAKAEEEENAVSDEDRALLVEMHRSLVQEVRLKNEKIKILIDQLRELHRDIIIMLACYLKPLSTPKRS